MFNGKTPTVLVDVGTQTDEMTSVDDATNSSSRNSTPFGIPLTPGKEFQLNEQQEQPYVEQEQYEQPQLQPAYFPQQPQPQAFRQQPQALHEQAQALRQQPQALPQRVATKTNVMIIPFEQIPPKKKAKKTNAMMSSLLDTEDWEEDLEEDFVSSVYSPYNGSPTLSEFSKSRPSNLI